MSITRAIREEIALTYLRSLGDGIAVCPLKDQTNRALSTLVRVGRHIGALAEAADAILWERRYRWYQDQLRLFDEHRWGSVRISSLALRAEGVPRVDRLADERLTALVKAARRNAISLT